METENNGIYYDLEELKKGMLKILLSNKVSRQALKCGMFENDCIKILKDGLDKKIPNSWYNTKTKTFFEKGKELKKKIIHEILVYCLEENWIDWLQKLWYR